MLLSLQEEQPMVVFGPNVENQFLACVEEEGGELTLPEEGEEMNYFLEDNTKNQKQSSDPKIEAAELNCLDPQEHLQLVVLYSEIEHQSSVPSESQESLPKEDQSSLLIEDHSNSLYVCAELHKISSPLSSSWDVEET